LLEVELLERSEHAILYIFTGWQAKKKPSEDGLLGVSH
jgi:hypothetical protein